LLQMIQAIVTDNDGNTNNERLAILGGDPPPPNEEEEDDERMQIRVFPNPVQNGEVTIAMKKEGIYTVRVFDLQGQKVEQFMFDGIDHQFVTRGMSVGIYVLEIQDQEEALFKMKLVVN